MRHLDIECIVLDERGGGSLNDSASVIVSTVYAAVVAPQSDLNINVTGFNNNGPCGRQLTGTGERR